MEEQSSDHLARFNASQEALITLALESWRFTKVFERAIVKLDPTEISRFLSQYRWFLKKWKKL